MATLICHTEGCVNADVPIDYDLTNPENGEQMPAYCGPCGQPITDVAPDAATAAAGGDDPWPT